MKNLKAKLRKNGGFTLIEMLIVVAIIAILIAVSIPLVASALEKARDATDQANERAAKAETLMYFMGAGDGLTIGGKAYEAGGEIKDTDKVYYDAVNGILTTTQPKGYGQCRGDATDKYSPGDPHTGDVILVKISTAGVFSFDWTPGAT